jgi:hypothetical protein
MLEQEYYDSLVEYAPPTVDNEDKEKTVAEEGNGADVCSDVVECEGNSLQDYNTTEINSATNEKLDIPKWALQTLNTLNKAAWEKREELAAAKSKKDNKEHEPSEFTLNHAKIAKIIEEVVQPLIVIDESTKDKVADIYIKDLKNLVWIKVSENSALFKEYCRSVEPNYKKTTRGDVYNSLTSLYYFAKSDEVFKDNYLVPCYRSDGQPITINLETGKIHIDTYQDFPYTLYRYKFKYSNDYSVFPKAVREAVDLVIRNLSNGDSDTRKRLLENYSMGINRSRASHKDFGRVLSLEDRKGGSGKGVTNGIFKNGLEKSVWGSVNILALDDPKAANATGYKHVLFSEDFPNKMIRQIQLSIIKNLIGGDVDNRQGLFQEQRTVEDFALIVLTTNHKYMLSDTDNSVQRRWNFFRIDLTLKERFARENPEIAEYSLVTKELERGKKEFNHLMKLANSQVASDYLLSLIVDHGIALVKRGRYCYAPEVDNYGLERLDKNNWTNAWLSGLKIENLINKRKKDIEIMLSRYVNDECIPLSNASNDIKYAVNEVIPLIEETFPLEFSNGGNSKNTKEFKEIANNSKLEYISINDFTDKFKNFLISNNLFNVRESDRIGVLHWFKGMFEGNMAFTDEQWCVFEKYGYSKG